ncbi:hypothetical protein L6164_036816 [Bauhinia variegata]|uniref:Uncharacterized protein n=1 Tax=Bauhinia variegata TaxID=167791 RepID=A0ACB9KIA7_BAUVA|nr:hypothetical protein L6164_036816 [Bauhinia variegata]
MKPIIAIFTIFCACAFPALARTLNEASVVTAHEQWMAKYGLTYANDAEKNKHFNIFMENLQYIENFNNAGNKSYKMGLNKFSDLTTKEFIASHTGIRIPSLPKSSKEASFSSLNLEDVPTSLDWRKKGAVTQIKQQGQCGKTNFKIIDLFAASCWAFSTVAAVEGIIQIKTGTLISLSEQQLVDCATNGGNEGCGGGWMENGFQYIIGNQGIASEADYPYEGINGTCGNRRTPAAKISGYQRVPADNEEKLLQALINQPISVLVSINDEFRHYAGGVFSGPCSNNLNHGVTLIGYGTSDNGTKYWLIKNSWGENWGEDGYMKLLRDSDNPEGLCGIAKQATYPTVD